RRRFEVSVEVVEGEDLDVDQRRRRGRGGGGGRGRRGGRRRGAGGEGEADRAEEGAESRHGARMLQSRAMRERASRLGLAAIVVACGCSKSTPAPSGSSGAVVFFDANAELTSPDHFYDFPWPSDLRLDANGAPEVS